MQISFIRNLIVNITVHHVTVAVLEHVIVRICIIVLVLRCIGLLNPFAGNVFTQVRLSKMEISYSFMVLQFFLSATSFQITVLELGSWITERVKTIRLKLKRSMTGTGRESLDPTSKSRDFKVMNPFLLKYSCTPVRLPPPPPPSCLLVSGLISEPSSVLVSKNTRSSVLKLPGQRRKTFRLFFLSLIFSFQ